MFNEVTLEFIDNIDKILIKYVKDGVEKTLFFRQCVGKRKSINTDEVFNHPNNFLKKLNSLTKIKLWELFVRLDDVLTDTTNISVKENQINSIYSEMFRIITLMDVKSYVVMNVRVNVEFNNEYIEDRDKNTSIEKTYLRDQYIDLLGLTILLRFMMPAWGDYISSFKSTTELIEMYAVIKLVPSFILNSEPMNKLVGYIKAIDKGSEECNGILLSRINNEDRLYWLLSKIIIRRLLLCDLSPEEGSLISNIHSFLSYTYNNEVDSSNKKLLQRQPLMNSETVSSEGSDDKNGFERIKQVSVKSPSLDEIELFTSDPFRLYESLRYFPETNVKRLEHFIDVCTGIEGIIPKEIMTICKWVLKPAMPTQALDYINDINMIRNVLAVTATVLYEKKYYWLSALVSSVTNKLDNSDEDKMFVNAVVTKVKVDHRIPELAVISPILSFNAKKSIPPIYELIQLMSTRMQYLNMILLVPIEHKKLINIEGSRLKIPPDVNNMLIDLVLDLYKSQEMK